MLSLEERQALREATKIALRQGLLLPEAAISDRAIEFLTDAVEPNRDNDALANSFVDHVFNEASLARIERTSAFTLDWLAASSKAAKSGDPTPFLEQVLEYLPVSDSANYANDVAAAAALKRSQVRDQARRLIVVADRFMAPGLNSGFLADSDDDNSLAVQALMEALAQTFAHTDAIARGALVKQTSGVYATVVHDYLDSVERCIDALEAVTRNFSESSESPPPSSKPLLETVQSQCQFSRMFGIVHSAAGGTRNKSPARSLVRRPPRQSEDSDDNDASDSDDDDDAKALALQQQLAARPAELVNENPGIVQRVWRLTSRKLVWVLVNILVNSFVVCTGLFQLCAGAMMAMGDNPVTAMKAIVRVFNEAFGYQAYMSGRQANFFEETVSGYFVEAPGVSDSLTRGSTAVTNTIIGLPGAVVGAVGNTVLRMVGLANEAAPAELMPTMEIRQLQNTMYVPGTLFTLRQQFEEHGWQFLFRVLRYGRTGESEAGWAVFHTTVQLVLIVAFGLWMVEPLIRTQRFWTFLRSWSGDDLVATNTTPIGYALTAGASVTAYLADGSEAAVGAVVRTATRTTLTLTAPVVNFARRLVMGPTLTPYELAILRALNNGIERAPGPVTEAELAILRAYHNEPAAPAATTTALVQRRPASRSTD